MAAGNVLCALIMYMIYMYVASVLSTEVIVIDTDESLIILYRYWVGGGSLV